MIRGWKKVKLHQIVDVLVMGQSPDSTTYNTEGIGLPFIQGNADIVGNHPKIRIFTSDPKKISLRNDILITVRAPVGDLYINNIDRISIGRGIGAIRITEKSLSSYIYHYFTWDKTQFNRLQQGTTFTEIGKREVRNLYVQLPESPYEQRAIAGVLSKVDEAITVIENSIKATERLKKSLMQNLLTGKLKTDGTWRSEDEFYVDEKFGMVPIGWEVKKLKDVTLNAGEYGANASALNYQEDLPRFIRITDIDYLGNLIEDEKVSIEIEKARNYILKDNDFLFARTGDTVGKSLLYKSNMGFAAFAGYLIKFTFNSELIIPEYFKLIASSDYFEAFKVAMKRVGAKPNINSREYGSFKFPLPINISEQQEVLSKIAPFEVQIECANRKKDSLKTLKKSLLQNLLTGKVRVDVEKTNKILEGYNHGQIIRT